MSVKVAITTSNGVESREVLAPDGWEVFDCYHPHATPWDYYGKKHVKEVMLVLQAAGIEAADCSIYQTKLHPCGTGPGGRVRFGDAFLPGVYRVAVPAASVGKAREAWAAHRIEVLAWLDGNGPMPDACK
jgi:hypothetical protein